MLPSPASGRVIRRDPGSGPAVGHVRRLLSTA